MLFRDRFFFAEWSIALVSQVCETIRNKTSQETQAMGDFVIRCANGHKIQVKDEYRGRRLACPKCRAHVRVPEIDEGDDPLSDLGLLEILGDVPPLPPQPEKGSRLADRTCVQCGGTISHHITVCNHCQTFLGVSSELLKDEQTPEDA